MILLKVAFDALVSLVLPKKMQPAMEFGMCYIHHHLKASNWNCLWMMVVILIEGAAQEVQSLYLCEGFNSWIISLTKINCQPRKKGA